MHSSQNLNATLAALDQKQAAAFGFEHQLFGSSTGVDKTIIGTSVVEFYGDKLATIKSALRHMAATRVTVGDQAELVLDLGVVDVLSNDWSLIISP